MTSKDQKMVAKLDAAKQELLAVNKLLGCILSEGVTSQLTAVKMVDQIYFNRDVITFIEKGRVP